MMTGVEVGLSIVIGFRIILNLFCIVLLILILFHLVLCASLNVRTTK